MNWLSLLFKESTMQLIVITLKCQLHNCFSDALNLDRGISLPFQFLQQRVVWQNWSSQCNLDSKIVLQSIRTDIFMNLITLHSKSCCC
mmetsp:Transcript_32463/g.30946  ORF Transcript_32463/g.30946 Transcript_32463/m.30946 type:complete len:88 (+) Transcript_32463:516-779(+)